MAETFEAYRTRVLSYLGDEEPISVQQATPSQLDWRLRDVALDNILTTLARPCSNVSYRSFLR
jgi:hypothetical protein